MSPKDLLLALVVIVVWGMNFVVIKVGLDDMPPMLLGALRFLLAAFPAILFIKRPQIPLRWLLAYGLTISFGQFAFLFSAMSLGMPAGLASLVLQSQAFFTLLFAVLLLGERLRRNNLFGLLVAAAGLLLEGPQAMESALRGFGLSSILVLIYLAFGATILGYGLWSRLLSRYPASQVAPFSLLVPVVGLSSAALLLDEHLSGLQLLGALLVMCGLLLNVCGGWLYDRLRLARVPG